MQKFEKDNKMKGHILVSSPVDLEFEMFMIALAVNLLNSLLERRFKTTIQEDEEILKKKDLPHWKYLAVAYRHESKVILQSNIRLCNVLCHILARLQAEMNKGTNRFSKDELKAIYMERVEQFETEEEVFKNRLALRKYLRELILNQKRVIQKLVEEEEKTEPKGYSSGNSIVDMLNQEKQQMSKRQMKLDVIKKVEMVEKITNK